MNEFHRIGWTYAQLLNAIGHGSFYEALGITWREYHAPLWDVYFWHAS